MGNSEISFLFIFVFGGIISYNNVNCTQTQYPCLIVEECDMIRALVENQNSSIAQSILQRLGSKSTLTRVYR